MSIVDRVKIALKIDRALIFIWQSGPNWMIASLIIKIIQGFLPLILLYLMKLIVDSVTIAASSNNTPDGYNNLLFLIILTGIITLFDRILYSSSRMINEIQSRKTMNYTRSKIHEKSLELDLSFFEDSNYFDTLHRAQQEGEHRLIDIINGLTSFFQHIVGLFAIACLLISFNVWLSLLIFISLIPGFYTKLKNIERRYYWINKGTMRERKANFYDRMITEVEYAKEIRIFSLGYLFKKRFFDLKNNITKELIKLFIKGEKDDFIGYTGGIIIVFTALSYIARQAYLGHITLGDMIMYFQAFQRGLSQLQQILNDISKFYSDNLYLSYLYDFFKQKSKIKLPEKPIPFPAAIKSGIIIDNLTFKYPGKKHASLSNICMKINPGQFAALVGENGSGKSTLVKLLCRLYDPTEGCISIDGIDLKNYHIEDLRKAVSVTFQDFANYPFSARENIWLGDIQKADSDTNINHSAFISGAEQIIKTLPNGYDTNLGSYFKGGQELSKGQWQKIAISRMFFSNAPILILDEPTSAIDSLSEANFFNHFNKHIGNKIVLLISHRFSTIQYAEKIYVLKNGSIVESGSHNDLIKQHGLYSKMYTAQYDRL